MRLTQQQFNELYQPKQIPMIIDVPTLKYITIEGEGDPNDPPFQRATEALYAISYAIKMSYKKPNPPKGYYEYKVFPLEGIWDFIDQTKASTDKSNYRYQLMIQQPDFVDRNLFESFQQEIMRKKHHPRIMDVTFEELTDAWCCQMLHIGSYDDEPQSFLRMASFIQSQGYERSSMMHKEIYLSDPRKTEASRLKTILRFKINKK